MKDYQKPEFELINLVAQEDITNDYIDASMEVGTVPPELDW